MPLNSLDIDIPEEKPPTETVRVPKNLSWKWVPAVVFSVGLLFTAYDWQRARELSLIRVQANFENEIEQATAAFLARYRSLEELLFLGQRLGMNEGGLEVARWGPFIHAHFHKSDPVALQAMGFVAAAPSPRWKAVLADGTPASDPSVFLAVNPASGRMLRQAMAHAHQVALPTATGKITLRGTPDTSGVLLFLPVYQGSPRRGPARLQGWLFMALRIDDLFKDLYEQYLPNVNLEIVDTTALAVWRNPGNGFLLFRAKASTDPTLEGRKDLQIGGRQWTLRFVALPTFRFAEGPLAAWKIVGWGLSISLLAAFFAWKLVASQVRLHLLREQISANLHEQELLRHNEQYFRALIENVSDIITVLHPDGTIRYSSPSVERVLGYRPEDMYGASAFAGIHEEDRALAEKTFLQGLQAPNVLQTCDFRFRHRNGSWKTLEAVGKYLADGTGLHLIIIISRDITERHQLEAQVRQSEKLYALGRLAAGVAHELNNPLTGIMGFTQLLLEKKGLDTQDREDLETIYRQTQRCREIIQHLLHFSRRSETRKETLDLNALVETTLQLIRYDFATSGIDLVANPPAEPVSVFGDANQIQQVFLNLMTNARQAMEGRPQRRLAIGIERKNGIASVRFADTGVGIPSDILPKVFDPFFTTKPPGQGTGLGLSICHGILQEHQGNLRVESEIGVGSAFIVELPVHA